MRVTVILPVYNCSGCLAPLVAELIQLGPTYRFIFVDDCSADTSLVELREAIAYFGLEHVQIFKSETNEGSHKAVLSAAPHISTELVAIMAADGQDDPAHLSKLIDSTDKCNADMALTASKSDSRFSQIFHLLMCKASKNGNNLTEIRGLSPAMMLCRRSLFESIAKQPDRHLYYHALVKSTGCVVHIEERRVRISGKSQWGSLKKVRFAARWIVFELLS